MQQVTLRIRLEAQSEKDGEVVDKYLKWIISHTLDSLGSSLEEQRKTISDKLQKPLRVNFGVDYD